MIRELHVVNLALIEDISLEFKPGFSVFTGETGAGKSILVGAIGLLLGDRADTDMIRRGADEAEISGTFELARPHPARRAIARESDIPLDDDTLIIRRRIQKNGKGRAYVNQVPVPLSTLGRIGDLLVDFHGQHEHQSLLDPDSARAIIDSLPGVAPAARCYAETYHAYVTARSALDEHDRKAQLLKQQRDMLEFQLKELSALSLKPGEEDRLEKEVRLLSSAAQRGACAADIARLLGDEADPMGKKLAAILRKLQTLARYDSAAAQWVADVGNAATLFAELESFCGGYAGAVEEESDPARLERVNERLAKIQRLKKKYATDLDGLCVKQHSIQADLAALDNAESDRQELEKACSLARDRVTAAGRKLSAARAGGSAAFDMKITAQMARLRFDGGQWVTAYTAAGEPQPCGMEQCAFLVRTNPGEPLLSLIKTASGGEISRLMLAIKSVMARHDRIPVLVFDEVDTGIGGMLAHEVARCIASLASSHQVLCISHLHQIAAAAHHHFLVYKESAGDRTVTRVRSLDDTEKIEEIARMLGGDSQIARTHARELLRKNA